MEAYIQANSLLVYAIVMVAAALLHWGQKARKGEATAEFMTYWFTETPGYSLGTFGALGGTLWLIYTTNGLDKMAAHMIVEGAFATGWAINSAVSPGSAPAKVLTATADKVAGFVRLSLLPWLVVLAVAGLLVGCAGMGPQAELPKTIPEQIEAANLLVDKLSDGIVEMTCTQFKKGQCIEPGKPLMPDDALIANTSIQRAHAALMMVSGIPIKGVGECMGKQRTQSACLAAASALLTEVDRMLMAKKGVQ